jgi:hypothetical protein
MVEVLHVISFSLQQHRSKTEALPKVSFNSSLRGWGVGGWALYYSIIRTSQPHRTRVRSSALLHTTPHYFQDGSFASRNRKDKYCSNWHISLVGTLHRQQSAVLPLPVFLPFLCCIISFIPLLPTIFIYEHRTSNAFLHFRYANGCVHGFTLLMLLARQPYTCQYQLTA